MLNLLEQLKFVCYKRFFPAEKRLKADTSNVSTIIKKCVQMYSKFEIREFKNTLNYHLLQKNQKIISLNIFI